MTLKTLKTMWCDPILIIIFLNPSINLNFEIFTLYIKPNKLKIKQIFYPTTFSCFYLDKLVYAISWFSYANFWSGLFHDRQIPPLKDAMRSAEGVGSWEMTPTRRVWGAAGDKCLFETCEMSSTSLGSKCRQIKNFPSPSKNHPRKSVTKKALKRVNWTLINYFPPVPYWK